MIKFSLKIDDDAHSLTKEEGISFDKIGELLQGLYEAIDPNSDVKCTLGEIRGNCYALDFYTTEERYLENFIIVHKNIESISYDDLEPNQKSYAKTLRKVLGGKYYINAYDSNNQKVASIKDIGRNLESDTYYSTKTIYGIVSELGGTSLNSTKKHIKVDGISYNIRISKDQDIELKPYYGTDKLKIKIKQKRSLEKGRVIDSELLSFVAISGNNIIDNLKNEGYIEFELIKGTHTILAGNNGGGQSPVKHLTLDSRIRRLTPLEYFRLQAFPDEFFHKAKAVNSDSQCYKQAGNSITVTVIESIIKNLLHLLQ